MSEARTNFRVGMVRVLTGVSTVDLRFDSPMADLDYGVFFQQRQTGTYDIWPSMQDMTGFRMNIFPSAVSDLVITYVALDQSFGDAALALVQALSPAAWYRYGLGLTGSPVSQWDDQSGNARHLKQAAGTNQPALQVDGSILFDGGDNYMKTDTFPLIQPTTIYMLCKQVTWTINDTFCDGFTTTTGRVWQRTATPTIALFSGAGAASNTNMAIDTYAVVCAVFNGASSILRVNNTAEVTGDPGAGNMDGFTLGSAPNPGNHGNVQVKEVILYPDAHDLDTRTSVVSYLAQVGGLSI